MTKHVKWTTAFRLERNSIPEPNSGCWLWTGSRVRGGYGKFNPLLRAHRVSYEEYKGPIPNGMFVCHRCDTPSCINPNHLFLGLPKDNVEDMMAKGRMPLWNRRKDTKLTGEQVEQIRMSSARKQELADFYGVSVSLIRLICKGTRRKSG